MDNPVGEANVMETSDDDVLGSMASKFNEDSQKKEVVDSWFWLKWAKTSIEEAPKRIDNEFKNIRTTIGWVFTVQIITTVLNFSFSGLNNWLYITILSLPLPFLIIAYFYSGSKAKIELSEGIDPRVPSQVRKSYNNILDDKIENLKQAKRFGTLSFFLLFLALILASFIKFSPQSFTKENNFTATVFNDDYIKDKRQISITGHLPPKDTITIYIDSYCGITSELITTHNLVINDVKKYTNNNSGDFMLSFPVESEAVKYSVRMEWTDDGLFKSLRRDLELSDKAKISNTNSSTLILNNPGSLNDPPDTGLEKSINDILNSK